MTQLLFSVTFMQTKAQVFSGKMKQKCLSGHVPVRLLLLAFTFFTFLASEESTSWSYCGCPQKPEGVCGRMWGEFYTFYLPEFDSNTDRDWVCLEQWTYLRVQFFLLFPSSLSVLNSSWTHNCVLCLSVRAVCVRLLSLVAPVKSRLIFSQII